MDFQSQLKEKSMIDKLTLREYVALGIFLAQLPSDKNPNQNSVDAAFELADTFLRVAEEDRSVV